MVRPMGALLGAAAIALALVLTGCGGKLGTAPSAVAHWDLSGTAAGTLDFAEGIRIGRDGSLWVADTWNDRVVQTNSQGEVLSAFGEFGYDEGELQCPHTVAVDQVGNVYVAESWNHRVQKFSPDGKALLVVGSRGGPWGYDEADGKFLFPLGVAVDSERHIFVSDFNNNRVQMFDQRGTFLMKWGTGGRQDGQFNRPAGLAIDSQDRLYVADMRNNRIQRFRVEEKVEEVDGEMVTKYETHFDGKWGEEGTELGEFDRPYDVCVDGDDNFYVADFGNHRIQKFSPNGHVLWIYGSHGSGEDELDSPISVAVAESDVVYISDWGNNRITKLAPAS